MASIQVKYATAIDKDSQPLAYHAEVEVNAAEWDGECFVQVTTPGMAEGMEIAMEYEQAIRMANEMIKVAHDIAKKNKEAKR